MVLSSIFILPHGSIILDPLKEGISYDTILLHNEMKHIGDIIKQTDPEIVFLLTPHGICLSNDYGIYANKGAKGTAEWEGEYDNFEVEINLDQDTSINLFDFLKQHQIDVSTITSFAGSLDIPLRWGEVVPLWFLKDVKTHYVLMSLPIRRYNHAKEMIPELLNLGKYLTDFFESLEKRCVIIISADLAHTHSEEGPYGYSEESEEFDILIEKWVKTMNKDFITSKAAIILDQALCCGYTGFIVLQGILQSKQLKSKFHIRKSPSYYGMLIASFN
jgi:aromatic ring-opening dioxygenase LigB subunit